jgi:hypothetical protein
MPMEPEIVDMFGVFASRLLTSYLSYRVSHVDEFRWARIFRRDPELKGTLSVDQLLPKLTNTIGPESKAPTVRATGVFSPAVLMHEGWWNKSDHKISKPAANGNLQSWLTTGFEEWGPSWDLRRASDDYILGQIGSRDESNSLLVAIVGDCEKQIGPWIRDYFKNRFVSSFSIKGLLCHRDQLEHHQSDLAHAAERWGAAFNHCLVLDNPDEHSIQPNGESQPEYYSGYLWQCWCPTLSLNEGDPKQAKPEDCYFVWEHTDYTKPDAIDYNLDSLQHKVEFITKKYGDMVLLQNSGPLLPGTPLLSPDDFHRTGYGLPR